MREGAGDGGSASDGSESDSSEAHSARGGARARWVMSDTPADRLEPRHEQGREHAYPPPPPPPHPLQLPDEVADEADGGSESDASSASERGERRRGPAKLAKRRSLKKSGASKLKRGGERRPRARGLAEATGLSSPPGHGGAPTPSSSASSTARSLPDESPPLAKGASKGRDLVTPPNASGRRAPSAVPQAKRPPRPHHHGLHKPSPGPSPQASPEAAALAPSGGLPARRAPSWPRADDERRPEGAPLAKARKASAEWSPRAAALGAASPGKHSPGKLSPSKLSPSPGKHSRAARRVPSWPAGEGKRPKTKVPARRAVSFARGHTEDY